MECMPYLAFYFLTLQILKREIHIPRKNMEKKIADSIDYPPTLKIYAEQTTTSSSQQLFAEVQVIGLDIECSFKRIPAISKITILSL